MMKSKLYFLINVLGIGIAITFCITSFLNLQFANQFDRMHPDADQIYRLTIIRGSDGVEHGFTPRPMGEAMVADIPQVTAAFTLEGDYSAVTIGEQVFEEDIFFANQNLLDIFQYPILAGDPAGLKNPTNVVLDEKTARKYFGDTTPLSEMIGATLTIYPGYDYQKELRVGTIIKNHALNSSVQFGFLSHHKNFIEDGMPWQENQWDKMSRATIFKIKNPEQAAAVQAALAKYIPIQNEKSKGLKVDRFQIASLPEFAKRGDEVNSNWLWTGMVPAAKYAPGIMAFLLLLLACLNFSNTSIALSGKRLKEIGIRKVMGGTRSQLVLQLISESLLVGILGIGVGILFAEWYIPFYNAMWPYLHLEAEYFSNIPLILFLLGCLIFATVLAGGYPAFYISRFNPNQIFRGSVKFGNTSLLSRGMLGMQISISLAAIIGAFAFLQNAEFQAACDVGFDRDNLVYIYTGDQATTDVVKQAAEKNPVILEALGTPHHFGRSYAYKETTSPGSNPVGTAIFSVDKDYPKLMGVKIIEGNDFAQNNNLEQVLVTEKLVERFQWARPLGQTLIIDSARYVVQGVIRDVIQRDFFNTVDPLALRVSKPDNSRFLVCRVSDSEAGQAILRSTWQELFPFKPYSGRLQSEIFAEGLDVNINIKNIFFFLAIVAILLTATGLLALVSVTLQRRQKEMAIRKVLGASLANLSYILNKSYLIIFFIALLLGSVIGMYAAKILISSIFLVYEPLNIWVSILSSIIMLAMAMMIIGLKIRQMATTNPSDILKSE